MTFDTRWIIMQKQLARLSEKALADALHAEWKGAKRAYMLHRLYTAYSLKRKRREWKELGMRAAIAPKAKKKAA